jgi:galactose mutarotase-like enzyme
MNRREFMHTAAGSLVPALVYGTTQEKSVNPQLRQSQYKDQTSFVLENGVVRAEFVAHGARMVSLRDKRLNHEFLFQQSSSKYVRGEYGGLLSPEQAAGYDDMFPTISECFYEDYPWKGVHMPDHGEVWSLDWVVHKEGQSLSFTAAGVRLPYRLTRTITLPATNQLRMDYVLENLSDFEMFYVWSAHPILKAEPGCRIVLPEECRQGRTAMSLSGRLGAYGDDFNWPIWTDSKGKRHDLSLLRGPQAQDAEKYFFRNKLIHGWCRFEYPSSGANVNISFPPDELPYLAIVVAENAPGDPRSLILLEPCSAPFDRIDLSKLYTKNSKVAARGVRKWFVTFSLDDKTQG